MKSEIYNNGQPVAKEDRDHDQQSGQAALLERWTDLFGSGVLRDSQLAAESAPFKVDPGTGLNINIGTGVAIAPGDVDVTTEADTGGERILIPVSDVDPGDLYVRDATGWPGGGTGTGPFTETADGLGGFTGTPQSTLTRDIPVTNGSMNYVWLGYLSTTDAATTSLHKVTSEILFPKRLDGYDIIVNTSASAPTSALTGSNDYILLATVDMTLSPVAVSSGEIDESGKQFAQTKGKRVGLDLDSATLKPATYADPSTTTAEDHVNSIGTGTVSPSNAHGNTIGDFGVPTRDLDVKAHRKQHHTKGLIGDSVTVTSSLSPFADAATPIVGDDGMVFLKQLISGEEVVLDGELYTAVWPQLTGIEGAGQVGDVYVSFGPATDANTDPTVNPFKPTANDTVQTYVVYLKDDGAGNLTALSKPGTTTLATEYPIAFVSWNGSAATVSSDERLFGLTGNKDIQDLAVETAHLQDDSVDSDKLADLAVDNAALQDNSVSLAKMQDNSVDTDEIVDLAVEEAQLGALAVTEAKIGPAAVTSAKVGDDAILSQHIEIADATDPSDPDTGDGIATDHIRDGAITAVKLAAGVASAATWEKFTVAHNATEWLGSGASGARTIFQLAQAGVIHVVVIKHSQSFAGIGTATVELGDTLDPDKYASAFDVFQSDGDAIFQISHPVNMSSFSVTPTNILATLRVDTQIGNTSAGSVDIYVLKSVLPIT